MTACIVAVVWLCERTAVRRLRAYRSRVESLYADNPN